VRAAAGEPISFATDGAVAIATLNRPPVNAIDEAWVARLDEIIGMAERDTRVAVLLIRSGQRAFSAGADLALLRSRFDTAAGRARLVAFVREIQRVYARIEDAGTVSIAEIGGPALGGGLELALACDLRVIADSATVGLPEAQLGLLPGAGGTQRLTRVCGPAVARRLILGAEVVQGAEAAALGIAHWVVPAAQLQSRTRAIADRIAGWPTTALAACKRCIALAAAPRHEGYEAEIAATAALLGDADTQRRVRAFLERTR
jgi:enoyl-CoA hydratase/carnithine racemase